MSYATKKDLVAEVASVTGLTKTAAKEAVEATLAGISKLTFDKGHLTLRGFGKFRARRYAARVVKGGVVGREVQVPARTVLTYSANPDQTRVEA